MLGSGCCATVPADEVFGIAAWDGWEPFFVNNVFYQLMLVFLIMKVSFPFAQEF